ncbi:hypothetical protein H7J87_00435 [Mycolicibacterium wolinskyi]|uniref:Uncharacterized protein n=1 Tax=Mycolicibacterium wolinskyi TaxID=59750 RepID=A0A1X2FBW1_9MYCO|nr:MULTISPECIES: hypothetical protein [Mycolicibacterium]MCV7283797.1 hypothetical protein [Mycolicibacterium wolinskyi]MCV7297231.1 hypothetical protein [Mycolicibacterium goodii]ORX15915.1 hypothetical protein AWC31_00560 [Mycolicibacterium wolinskyi]
MAARSTLNVMDISGDWDTVVLLTGAVMLCWLTALITATVLFGHGTRDERPARATLMNPAGHGHKARTSRDGRQQEATGNG